MTACLSGAERQREKKISRFLHREDQRNNVARAFYMERNLQTFLRKKECKKDLRREKIIYQEKGCDCFTKIKSRDFSLFVLILAHSRAAKPLFARNCE